MVPFKPYFLGQETPPYQRATSVQKCVRTLDIEEVGKTTRHGTFFQMNGNFSFGDYFKEGAIELAWELVTGSQADGGYGFDPSPSSGSPSTRTTTRPSALWKQGRRPARRAASSGCGKKDNYWHMGVPGPGGPCSEISSTAGRSTAPTADRSRTRTGTWRSGTSSSCRTSSARSAARTTSTSLGAAAAAKNIDTGMGLERVAYLLQGVDNLYEIDEVYPVLERAAELAGKRYGALRRPARPRRRAAAGRRRPRAQRADADQRRRHPRQRGARLRAAPPDPPRRSARCACSASTSRCCPSCCRSAATRWRRRTPSWRPASAGSRRWRTPRRRRSGRPCAPAPRSSTRRSATTKSQGGTTLVRRPGVPAARHLRLPDRPHPRDGRRAGPRGRRGRLPPADARAARARQGRRAGARSRPRRRLRLPRGRSTPAAPTTFTGYDEVVSRVDASSACSSAAPAVPAASEGDDGRARARPHPVLRRGRRPARRPGRASAPRRRRRGRGARRPDARPRR